jgi:hypothetical protein
VRVDDFGLMRRDHQASGIWSKPDQGQLNGNLNGHIDSTASQIPVSGCRGNGDEAGYVGPLRWLLDAVLCSPASFIKVHRFDSDSRGQSGGIRRDQFRIDDQPRVDEKNYQRE